MPKSRLILSLPLDAALAESFSEALLEFGAESVALEDADEDTGNERARYGEPGIATPAAWERTRLSALFAFDGDVRPAVESAAAATGLHPLPAYCLDQVDDEDWVRRSQAQFSPVNIGERLWIVPSWHAVPADARVVIRLDPGRAFGTGTHPTTRLVLRWLIDALDERPGASVLDYGCGSGVLALAAAKLGASRVLATDLDPQALLASRENAQANRVDIQLCGTRDVPDDRYDLVVANILAQPLIDLAPLLSRRCLGGGRLALSGLLEAQAEEVMRAYRPYADISIAGQEESWVLLEAIRHREVDARA